MEFDLVTTCGAGFANERMGRYLVYWGTNAGGPFDNAASPLVVDHATAGPSPVTRRIAGLLPGTRYQIVVITEDQARNVDPPDFDPGADGAGAYFIERDVTTPAPCAVTGPCLYRSDVTQLQPHAPPRAAVYLVPPTAQDVSLRGAAYHCPFATGDLEPDATALTNGVALSLYQVDLAIGTLRLAKSGQTIRFTF